MPGEVGGALGRLADFLQVGMERMRRVNFHEGQFRMAEYDTQHVVEVVCHAARQSADRFHLLGLPELCLESGLLLFRMLALGNVLDSSKQ